MMHNHGTEEGPGLSCNEVLGPDGLVGSCVLQMQVRNEMVRVIDDLIIEAIKTEWRVPQEQTGQNYD
jgi:hypothetical protein